jgi:IclR family pca regulon transcriptional regulator
MGRVLLAGLPEPKLDRYFRETEFRQLTPFTVIDADRLKAIIALTRETGFAVNDQEMEVGLRSIAVPITNLEGTVMAALNVSCSTARISYVEMEKSFLPVLKSAAREISNLLVYSGIGSPQRPAVPE